MKMGTKNILTKCDTTDTNYSRWFHPEDQQLHSDNYRSEFNSSNNQKHIKYITNLISDQNRKKNIFNWSRFVSDITFVASILMTFKSYISEGGLKAANSLRMEKENKLNKIRVEGIVTLVLPTRRPNVEIPAEYGRFFTYSTSPPLYQCNEGLVVLIESYLKSTDAGF